MLKMLEFTDIFKNFEGSQENKDSEEELKEI